MRRHLPLLAVLVGLLPLTAWAVAVLVLCPVAHADDAARCRVTGQGVTGSAACRSAARRFAHAALHVGEGPLDTGTCVRSFVDRPHWSCRVFLSSGDVVAGTVRGERVSARLVT